MKRIIFLSLAIFSTTLFIQIDTLACGCGSSSNVSVNDIVKYSAKSSTMIFAGTVVGFEYRKDLINQYMESVKKDSGKHVDYETLIVKFQVERWWKGKPTSGIFLVTGETKNSDGTASNSSCNYKFKEGERYLIYAYGKKNELRTDTCTRTKPFVQAGEDLEILGKGEVSVKKKN